MGTCKKITLVADGYKDFSIYNNVALYTTIELAQIADPSLDFDSAKATISSNLDIYKEFSKNNVNYVLGIADNILIMAVEAGGSTLASY